MDRSIVFIGCLLYVIVQTVIADEWGYSGAHDPSHWYEQAPICGKDSQSPVDIKTNEVLIDPNQRMLKLRGYGQALAGEFVNNGHAVTLVLPTNQTYQLSGGGMGDNTYHALQLHFHWAAPTSTDGSEHTVDGKHYPVEMHIVHIKEPYTSLDQVKDMSDGLAVLGVFIDVGDKENPSFEKLLETAQTCKYKDSKTTLESGPRLISLLPDSASFYRYSGSLTTPPCYEAVTWTVFQEPVMISQSQLEMLQSLKSVSAPDAVKDIGHSMINSTIEDTSKESLESIDNLGGNYRPTQPLNGRIISSYLDIKFSKDEKGTHGWTYYGSDIGTGEWYQSYPTCGLGSQSPINIDITKTKKLKDAPTSTSPVKPLMFSGYDQALSGTFVNNGHAVKLNINNNAPSYTISGGGLTDSYTALQLHFHWGEISYAGDMHGGSEHTINDKRYPAEMHIVHGKTSYLSSLADFQANSSDTYVVIGLMIDTAHNDDTDAKQDNDYGKNENMQKLIEAIDKVTYKDDSVDFRNGPNLASLLPHDTSFYRYNGSLTTPPCSETVIWTLLSNPVTISVNQFIAFQRLFSDIDGDVIQRKSIKLLNEAVRDGKEDSYTILDDYPAESAKETLRSLVGGNSLNSKTLLTEYLPGNETKDHLLRNNYRPVQQLNNRIVYIYEDNGADPAPSGEPVESKGISTLAIILICIVVGVIVLIVTTFLVRRCCCKKQKKSKYTAAKRTDEQVNL